MSERDLSGLNYEELADHRRHERNNALSGREIYDILPALKSGVSLQRRMTYQRSIHLRSKLRSVLECCYKSGEGLPRIRGFGLFIRTKAVIDLDRVEQAKEDKGKLQGK